MTPMPSSSPTHEIPRCSHRILTNIGSSSSGGDDGGSGGDSCCLLALKQYIELNRWNFFGTLFTFYTLSLCVLCISKKERDTNLLLLDMINENALMNY